MQTDLLEHQHDQTQQKLEIVESLEQVNQEQTRHDQQNDHDQQSLEQASWEHQQDDSAYADNSHLDDVSGSYYEDTEPTEAEENSLIGPDGCYTEEGQVYMFQKGLPLVAMPLRSNVLSEFSKTDECAEAARALNRLAKQSKYTRFLCRPSTQNLADAIALGSVVYGLVLAMGEEKRIRKAEMRKLEDQDKSKQKSPEQMPGQNAPQTGEDGTPLTADPFKYA